MISIGIVARLTSLVIAMLMLLTTASLSRLGAVEPFRKLRSAIIDRAALTYLDLVWNTSLKVGPCISLNSLRLAVAFTLAMAAAQLLILSLIPLGSVTLPAILASCIGCLAVLLRPLLQVRARALEHAKGIRRELPYFAILMSISESVGIDLAYLLRRVAETKLFKYIRREAELVLRDSRLFFTGIVEALEFRARLGLEQTFSRFLYSYTARLRSGGNTLVLVREWVKDLLSSMDFEWSEFVNDASVIGQMAVALFLITPLLLSIMMFFMPGGVERFVTFLPLGLLPILIAVVEVSRPKTLDDVHNARLAPCIVLGVLIGVALHMSGVAPYVSVIVAWSTSAALGMAIMEKRIRDCMRGEGDAIPLLRSLSEAKRLGLEIKDSLRRLAESPELSPATRSVLERFLKLTEMGVPPTYAAAMVDTPSFLLRFSLYALGLIMESGGGDPQVLEEFLESVRRIHEARRRAREKLGLLAFLGTAIPIAAVVVIYSLHPLFTAMDSASIPFLPPLSIGAEELFPRIVTMSVLAAMSYAVIISRVIDGSFVSRLHIPYIASSVIAVLAYSYLMT